LADGLASQEVKLLDPAGGTLTFPAEAVRLAAREFKEKYVKAVCDTGSVNTFLRIFSLLNS